jgi:hypothetical protein
MSSSSYAAAASSTSRAPASGQACVRARATNNSDRPRPGKRGTTPLPRARPWSAAPPPAARPSGSFLRVLAGSPRLGQVPANHLRLHHSSPSRRRAPPLRRAGNPRRRASSPFMAAHMLRAWHRWLSPVRAPWRRQPPIPECSRWRRPPLLDVLAALLAAASRAAPVGCHGIR